MLQVSDAAFMARALLIARNGCYTSDPNPNVGCVLVKDHRIVAEGWHMHAGQGHAEVQALNNCKNPAGATAFVTLEPCSHFGKTPPCCDALIEEGIKRVVVAMQDPNPLVSGRGLQRLRDAGIEVDCGLMQDEAEQLNRGFIKRMQTGIPFVVSKLAMSMDGRTAMASGESQWITGKESRLDVHQLRAASSAILTGINTVIADDCALTSRLHDVQVLQPVRVVLDSDLRMPLNAKMASIEGRTLILTCSENVNKRNALEDLGFEVHQLPECEHGRLDLNEVLLFLGQQQINQVLVEAGAILNGALLQRNCVDEYVLYIAPSIMGHSGRALFEVPGLRFMSDKINLNIKSIRQIGHDVKLTLNIKGKNECSPG